MVVCFVHPGAGGGSFFTKLIGPQTKSLISLCALVRVKRKIERKIFDCYSNLFWNLFFFVSSVVKLLLHIVFTVAFPFLLIASSFFLSSHVISFHFISFISFLSFIRSFIHFISFIHFFQDSCVAVVDSAGAGTLWQRDTFALVASFDINWRPMACFCAANRCWTIGQKG